MALARSVGRFRAPIQNQNMGIAILLVLLALLPGEAFRPAVFAPGRNTATSRRAEEGWTGEVVANDDGRIRGCTVTPVDDTTFTIRVDGNEADLGNFGAVVYRKITSDAKRQQYQGFRPGTLPPHLLPTYRGFAMDEVAREATLEAMQQNDIRPFEGAREGISIGKVAIPPPSKKKKKKKGKKKKKAQAALGEEEDEVPAAWETFDTMDEALGAGWEPGQSFSFVATNCKGQKVVSVETEPPPVI